MLDRSLPNKMVTLRRTGSYPFDGSMTVAPAYSSPASALCAGSNKSCFLDCKLEMTGNQMINQVRNNKVLYNNPSYSRILIGPRL